MNSGTMIVLASTLFAGLFQAARGAGQGLPWWAWLFILVAIVLFVLALCRLLSLPRQEAIPPAEAVATTPTPVIEPTRPEPEAPAPAGKN